MKTKILMAAALLLAANTAIAQDAGEDECGGIAAQRATSLQRDAERGTQVMDGLVQTPDMSELDDCLDGILSGGWGVSLNMPSIGDLFNPACSMARQELGQRLGTLNQGLQVTAPGTNYGVTAGAGTGNGYSNTTTINTHDAAGDIVERIWRNH